MAYNDTQGTKYEATKNLSRAELKAAILGEIKTEMKAGRLPKCRVSMREGRGVGTLSLRVTIAGVPFKLLNAERVRLSECEPNRFVEEREAPRYTAEALSLRSRITAMIEEYNFDRSEIETDYFNVRFYLDVTFNSKEEEAERRAIIFAASPLRRELIELVESAYLVMNDALMEKGVKPWRYGPGDPTYFATQFDRVIAKLGMSRPGLTLSPRVHALKARIATADDWAAALQAAA